MSGPARKIIKKRPCSISVRLPTDAVRHAWPDDVANNLARRIAWFRELRGLTQDQLAERAGLSRMSVNDAESGQTHMDMRTLVTLRPRLRRLWGCFLRKSSEARRRWPRMQRGAGFEPPGLSSLTRRRGCRVKYN